MQFAGEIRSETVKREERRGGDKSAETRLTRAIDGGSVALSHLQRNVANDAEGGCTTRSRVSRIHHHKTDENQSEIHVHLPPRECK